MRFEGKFEVPVSSQTLYAFVTDPRRVVTIIPEVMESRIDDESHFSVKAKAGVGPVKGIIDMDFSLVEKRSPKSATLRGTGRGMQSTVDFSLSLSIQKTVTGCEARWTAEANVGGMLAGVGGRMLGGITERYVRQITDELKSRVAG